MLSAALEATAQPVGGSGCGDKCMLAVSRTSSSMSGCLGAGVRATYEFSVPSFSLPLGSFCGTGLGFEIGLPSWGGAFQLWGPRAIGFGC